MVEDASRRLAGEDRPDIERAVATVLATAHAAAAHGLQDAGRILEALVLLRSVQDQLVALEPALIEAARAAGASWQELAPALGVASRQAAERRYLRLVPATPDDQGSTRDGRVRAERDRRAGHRAVARWANQNTADLRQLAGQVTSLADLDAAAGADLDRLHEALADPDAAALPDLLVETRRHLRAHPDLADRIDAVRSDTDQVRRQTQERRDHRAHRPR